MANGLVMSHSKFLDFDIASYMVIEPFRLLVPWPREESRLLAPIRPFQLPVSNAHLSEYLIDIFKLIIHHNAITHWICLNLLLINWNKVWISLGVSIVILVPVLSFLAGFYHRYMQQRENETALDDSRIIRRRSIISFFSLLHNASFLLSHITNQGVSITTLFYYWMIVLGSSFESKMMMTLHYKTHIRLSLQSAPEVSQQLHLGRSLVSDGCRLGQRLRRSPLFISVRLKTATRPQLLGRSGQLERRHVSCYWSIRTGHSTLGITQKSWKNRNATT